MPNSGELPFLPNGFSGKARLFPLPDCVIFPHAVQPLHVFEPRYLDLVEDALNGDELIAIVQLQEGWQMDYEGRPPIAEVGCLGKILNHVRLDDGRFNLLLRGAARLRIHQEHEPEHRYREAEAELLEDAYPAAGASHRPELQATLIRRFRQFLPHMPEAQQQIDEFLREDVPLGVLTDFVAFAIELTPAEKQKLLGETDVDRRATQLIKELTQRAPSSTVSIRKNFPPNFSAN